jgi:hypothetical protein
MKLEKKIPTKKVKKLPGFGGLLAKTWQEIATFWRPLSGVVLVYGVLYFMLVLGFNLSVSYKDVADSVSSELGSGAGWLSKSSLTVVNLFTTSNQSDAGTMVQFMLFVIATLAFIWTLRQLRTLKHIRMRDAYFDGTSRIIPTMLVMVLLLVPFIPAAIGSSIFSVVNSTSNRLELTIAGLIAGLLVFVTFYWLSTWLPAIYIVSLPKGTPIVAIRSAMKLTKKHRFWMLRNILLFAILIGIFAFIFMVCVVLALPVASVVLAYIIGFVIFGITQTYLFTMYRSLLDES